MSQLFEEKIAKRFAKIKPSDFDFWEELDSVLRYAFFVNKEGKPVDFYNKNENEIAIAYILTCYGMLELGSTICAILLPKIMLKLAGGYEKVDFVMSCLEMKEKG